MKIAMISWEYPPQFSGGLGIHCQALVQELVKQGVFIDYYLPSSVHTEFDIPDGMVIHRVDIDQPFPAYLPSDNIIWKSVEQFRVGLEKIFRPEGVNLIHAHDWMGVHAAKSINELYHVPLLWTVHSTEYDRAVGLSPHPGIVAIEQDAVQSTTHIITVSARAKATLEANYNANPGAISVIYNGIEMAYFQNSLNRDYNRTDGNVLFLGRVTGQKAPDDFLQAARLVLAERDVRFMITGDGEMLGPLRRRARSWKIDKHVTFTGTLTGEPLLECYRNAQIYVLPSISEPFGITVLEAMASGVPTIITTTTGAGEIVQNVHRVEPRSPGQLAKAILKLLDNPDLRMALALEGVREVRQFSWKAVADQTHQLYSHLVGQLQRKEP
ncbi:glycosyltransferase family 4 protein [Paenibacillus agricola]|uniref:Glycosyltransferase family 4 protein n=1 Tax=Paenibacillus agricola TaxID=2716264 RepID=A0ABX0J2G1_9BACL|nr:glycosyltransferase family 4 protein [Paenibacillus agricola]NHN28993.1 glycosyltransferase family 4 protein [Paenibacillus agricola]